MQARARAGRPRAVLTSHNGARIGGAACLWAQLGAVGAPPALGVVLAQVCSRQLRLRARGRGLRGCGSETRGVRVLRGVGGANRTHLGTARWEPVPAGSVPLHPCPRG